MYDRQGTSQKCIFVQYLSLCSQLVEGYDTTYWIAEKSIKTLIY